MKSVGRRRALLVVGGTLMSLFLVLCYLLLVYLWSIGLAKINMLPELSYAQVAMINVLWILWFTKKMVIETRRLW